MKALKQYTSFILLAVLMAGFTSCIHEWPEPAETTLLLSLSFPQEMPQGPVHEVDTRATDGADKYDLRYIIEVYTKNDDGEYNETAPEHRFEFIEDQEQTLDRTFSLTLIDGTYKFRAWVDYVDGETGEPLFYNAENFRYIKLFGRDEGMPHQGNTDYRDAFTATKEIEVIRYGGNHPPTHATMEMYRPMSKVVFITNDLDDWLGKVITNQKELLYQQGNTYDGGISTEDIDLSNYTVKVHYPQYMPNAFNLSTDRTAWSDVNVTFDAQLLRLSKTEASMGFDYVFANELDPKVVMSVSLHGKDGTELARSTTITVPLERGKVTTVKGSFLLEKSDGGVSINPDFDGEFNIVL